MKTFKRVVCAISGGVDSSVSAYLLKKKGFEVIGLFMRNWDLKEENVSPSCVVDQDFLDAQFVCKKLGIPYEEANFVKEYWNEVFTRFVESYESGETPNPDILCNKKIKFDAFHKHAVSHLGADAIATGHYANSSFGTMLESYNPSENAYLIRSADAVKDQTFFLSQVPQKALQTTMFPLGNLIKNEVKKIADKIDLGRIARKEESMGICFVGATNYQKFINDFIKPKPGKFIDIETGKCVGEHAGIHLWTNGQRCNISGTKHAYFVVRKNLDSTILVAPGTNHPSLYSRSVITEIPHWIHSKPTCQLRHFSCLFCFQHANPLVPCTLTELENGQLSVVLDSPLRALTSGQYAVFYSGDICLGSAKIITVGSSAYHLIR